MSSILQFLTVLILFIAVLAVTYLTTRWIARYQKGSSTGGNIELLEARKLSQNTYIQIVRVGGKYLAVAIAKDSVTMLTEIPEEQLQLYRENTDNTQKSKAPTSFQEIFKALKDSDLNKKK